MTLASLPLFVRLGGRAVILLGEGEAADAKRRLLDRAGAVIVGEADEAALAVVAIEDDLEAEAAVVRLKARGVLVNAVDRPAFCDFTIPAIVEREPVVVAVGTSGVSAGLAAALRQRLEALLPAHLGELAQGLHAARAALREAYPDSGDRRRAIAGALAPGGALDPLGADPDVRSWLDEPHARGFAPGSISFVLGSPDPDDLTLRQARALASADRVVHAPDVPPAILDRARADALRIESAAPPVEDGPGLTVYVRMA
ncbi:Siroheme synthase [Sphingomonas sp. EC-HK361]|uniref:precorrin-2 dehydrogenase/sirohydrochlorin ferrochelatase family protein n=1 Tax=Sphingomonas sp. EC-HK361 TaxID=2038397 RepID=UPI001254EA60|nr:bifunctional precorrin-2 dehydrogenase/sirohydrochlorin ferrochelatase [Sphingomonas sp. EC-HK361]VVS98579.1 Siroheme synthase [Sphingomonas sp. EC-HK361]